MANRFVKTQKAETPYHRVDRFVKQPFEEARQALENRQNQYDTSLATQTTAEDQARAINSRDVDVDAKNFMINKMNQQITDVVNTKYGGDYGAAHGEVQNLVHSWARNPVWEKIQSLGAQEAAHKALKAKAQAEGKTVLDFDTSGYNTPLLDQEGNYNEVGGYKSEIGLDRSDPMRKATALHADAFATELSKTPGAVGMLKSGNIEGISNDKIRRNMNNMYSSYQQSDAGKQHYRHLTEGQGLSDAAARKQITSELAGVAAQQQYTKQTAAYHADPQYAQNMANARAAAKIGATKAAQQGVRPTMVGDYTNKGMNLKSDGYYGSSDISLPLAGYSSRTLNQNVKDYQPTGRAYVFGKDQDADEVPLHEGPIDGKRIKMIAGYKIVGGDADPEKIGAPITKGKYGTVDAAQDNHVQFDQNSGKHFITYGEGNHKKRVEVQPQAYWLYQTKDGDNVLEEGDKHSSFTELGQDLSGQRWMEKNGQINANEQNIYEALQNNPDRKTIMDTMHIISKQGGPKTDYERDFVEAAEAAINQGFNNDVVAPRIINAKDEYAAKGGYGEQQAVSDSSLNDDEE